MKTIILILLLASNAFAATYTPTVTSVAHAGNLSANKAQYYTADSGNIVEISGSMTVGSDSSEELTKIRVTLPLSSNLTSVQDCHGTVGEAEFFNTGSVEADPANDAVVVKFLSSRSDETFSYTMDLNFKVTCEVK